MIVEATAGLPPEAVRILRIAIVHIHLEADLPCHQVGVGHHGQEVVVGIEGTVGVEENVPSVPRAARLNPVEIRASIAETGKR